MTLNDIFDIEEAKKKLERLSEDSQRFATDSQEHKADRKPRFATFARFAARQCQTFIQTNPPDHLDSAPPDVKALENLSTDDLTDWLKKVSSATSQQAVLAILDNFRPRAWSDEQRAQMSHTYIRRLETLQPHKEESKRAERSRHELQQWWQED